MNSTGKLSLSILQKIFLHVEFICGLCYLSQCFHQELLAYLAMYVFFYTLYRAVLVRQSECETEEPGCESWRGAREQFESLATYFRDRTTSIPLTFLLGFYVSLVIMIFHIVC